MKMISALLLASVLAAPAFAETPKPATTANDDSCDVSLLPAATLLLPYFEVDFNSPATTARTTLFAIQNTTAMPQIARVTLWTDWAYPMLTFNLFLTGYDVQGINIYDIFARGFVAPGVTPGTGGATNKTLPGNLSLPNDQNPHFLPDAATTCSNNPGSILPLLPDLKSAFTTGVTSAPSCAIVKPVGAKHANAIGYATIDVVANCNSTSPVDPTYFGEILFDNVLTGDYVDINPNPATGNYAGGNPLVHIRAIPEGGMAGQVIPTAMPYTFYDLYNRGAQIRTRDRRQPLPSAFMPRFISGGLNSFNTNLKIWREAVAEPTSCPSGYTGNSNMPVAELVRFDEHENATFGHYDCGGECSGYVPSTPATSSLSTANNAIFPPLSLSGDVGGWLFLNLNNGGSAAYSSTRNYRFGTTTSGPRQSQAWVITSMFAEGRYSVDMDAVAVGNGCSPAPELSKNIPIGPAP